MGVGRWVGVVLVAMTVWAVGCENKQAPTVPEGKLRVVATIFPLADVTRQIAGDDAIVDCLLGPGESPHEYQQRPEHFETLVRANLVVRVGLGIDDWAARALAGKGGSVLVVGEALPLAASGPATTSPAHDAHDEHDGHEHHAHGDGDPHIWLDPVFMQDCARHIAEALCQADPAHAAGYRSRLDGLIEQLRQLDADYARALQNLSGRKFVTFHAAFTYIAQRYGLEQMSLHTADAGGFGPEQVEKVADFVQRHNVRAIFVEPQFPSERLGAIARRSGVTVGRLDPLGNPGTVGYDSYLAMMRSNLQALVAGLKE